MGISFALEKISKGLVGELDPLFKGLYSEIAHNDSSRSYNPAPYFQLDSVGALRIFTARYPEGMVGFSIFFVGPNHQDGNRIEAKQDLFYLKQENRVGMLGFRFLSWCDEQLANDGATTIYFHTSTKLNYGKLLEKLGYYQHQIVYARRIRQCVPDLR